MDYIAHILIGIIGYGYAFLSAIAGISLLHKATNDSPESIENGYRGLRNLGFAIFAAAITRLIIWVLP